MFVREVAQLFMVSAPAVMPCFYQSWIVIFLPAISGWLHWVAHQLLWCLCNSWFFGIVWTCLFSVLTMTLAVCRCHLNGKHRLCGRKDFLLLKALSSREGFSLHPAVSRRCIALQAGCQDLLTLFSWAAILHFDFAFTLFYVPFLPFLFISFSFHIFGWHMWLGLAGSHRKCQKFICLSGVFHLNIQTLVMNTIYLYILSTFFFLDYFPLNLDSFHGLCGNFQSFHHFF